MIWMWLIACGDKVDGVDTGTDTEVTEVDESEEPSNEPSGEPSSDPSSEPGSENTEDTEDTNTEETDTPVEEDCPDGVVCVNTFPFSHEGDTSSSTRDDFDSYACSPSTNESGAEILYRVTLPDDGFLALNLPEYAMESGADVDVHLLGSENANDCIDRGHWAAGSLLTAGTYWVVVDTWVNSAGSEQSGSYELEMGFTSFVDLEDFGMDAQPKEGTLH